MERQTVKQNQNAPVRDGHVQRNAAGASPTRLVGLQSAIGNQAMRRLIDSPFIQAKLEVSQPGDPSEKEADRVADTVMRMPDTDAEDEPGKVTPVPTEFTPDVQAKLEDGAGRKETVPTEIAIQRVPLAVREDDGEEEEKESVATKPIDDAPVLRQAKADEEEETESSTPIQRQTEEEEEEKEAQRLQAHSASGHTPQVTPSITNNIRSLNGSGSPLPPATRAFFEPRFGSDFSGVRVHTDSRAADTAKSLQARAFTVGENIAFGSGQYAPESQAGRHLLAHELTHVVQQSDGQSKVNSSPDTGPTWAVGSPRGSLPPLPPVLAPMELKGETFFDPPQALADYLQARPYTPTWIAVKFGTLTSSEIPVYWDGTGYYTTKPPDELEGHPMTIFNDNFPVTANARPALAINVRNDVIEGFFGWLTSRSLAKDPQKFFEQHPLSELFGLEGLKSDPPMAGENELSGGKLHYHQPVFFTSGDFNGRADVGLEDEKYDFKGEMFVNQVKGIDKPMPITKEGKKLFGDFTWKFNRSLGAAGKLSGDIIGTFAAGKPDVRGTLQYSRSKPAISGTVTVIITSFDKARDEVMAQLGPDAPSSIEPANPDDSLAIAGWGHLDFSFNEWLTGNADVIVHPEGYVTAKGEIVPTVVIPILKKYEKEPTPIFDKSISKTIPGLDAWVADVAVTGSLTIEGYASLGPGTLHDLRVAGLFSTHPGIVNTFEFSGIMSTPAIAGITAIAEAKISARILKKLWEPAKVSLKITGNLALQLYAEAAAAAGRRTGDDGLPEYFLKGTLKGGAGLRLDLAMSFRGEFLWWKKHIDFFDRTYTIAGGSLTINFDYIIGKKPKKGEDRLKLVPEWGNFNQDEFTEAVLRGATVGDDKSFKGKEQREGDLETDPNPDAPPPVQPPDPAAPPPAGQPSGVVKTLEEPVKMENADHKLKLTISDPAEIQMESAIEPLINKVERARKELNKSSSIGAAEKRTRLATLKKIENSALAVQQAAESAAKNPAFITPQVPGFTKLAQLVSDYGKAYGVNDLGPALESISVDPTKPETVLKKFPGLAADGAVLVQVAFLIAAGISAPDLRKVVENVRPIKEDGVRKLIDVLERMVKSGATNWDKVVTDLRIGGNKFKGARFVLRYIDEKLGWNNVAFEVTNDPTDNSGRRWDARVNGWLYQFKSWYTWPDIANRTFLRQILEDYRLTRVGEQMSVSWIFETSLKKEDIVKKMKDALAGVVADLKAGNKPKVDGYTGGIALFIFHRTETIVADVVSP